MMDVAFLRGQVVKRKRSVDQKGSKYVSLS